MKKAHILFVVCLVAMLVLGAAISASADGEYYVSQIYIHGLPETIAAGQTVTAPDAVDGFDGTNIASRWLDAQGDPVATATFEDGKIYYLELTVTPKSGNLLDAELKVEAEYHYDGFVPTTGTEAKVKIRYSLLPKISEVSVAGAPSVTVGQAAPAVQISVPGDAAYTVADTYWWDEAYEVFTGIFETGKEYYLCIDMLPKQGYDFNTQEIAITVDGQPLDWINTYTNGIFEENMTIVVRYSFKQTVSQLDITVPQPQVGSPINTDGILLPQGVKQDPQNPSYWQEYGSDEPATGNFQLGKKYELTLNLVPDTGYEFTESYDIYINGQFMYEISFPWDAFGYMNTWGAYVQIEYSLRTLVNKVEAQVPDPQVGQDISLNGITLSEHLKIDTEDSFWTEQNPNHYPIGECEKATGKFQQGHKYYLYLSFEPDAGYEVDDNANVKLNGKYLLNVHPDNGYSVNSEGGFLIICYSFLEQVEKVEITGVTDAVVGQTATTAGIQITGGTIVEAYWYEEDADEPFTGAFEAGKAYYLYIALEPKAGAEFAEECEIYVNGELEAAAYGTEGYVYMRYTFKPQIEKVEITGITDAVVGQTATTEGIQITGGKVMQALWMDEDSGEPVTGAFEAGKAYYLAIAFEPEAGKEFLHTTTVTVNGKEPYYMYIDLDGGYAYLRYTFKTVIDKVELTGLPQFTVGGTATTENLKAPTGAKYTVDAQWYNIANGDSVSTFQNDGQYVLWIDVTPAEGYEFAENMVFLIDGKAPQTSHIRQDTSYLSAEYYYYPSATEITTVQVTAPVPTVGEKIDPDAVKAPEGAKYEVIAMWLVSSDGKNWEEAEGTFEEGKYYSLILYVQIEDDENYYLANELQIQINTGAVETEEMMREGSYWMTAQIDLGKLTVPKEDENPKTGDMGLALAVVTAMASFGGALLLKKKEN